MNHSSEKKGRVISLLAVYFAANVIFVTSPALNSWATQLYPEIPYSTVLFLSTISSLLMIPGSLAAGAVLGKRVSFKTMAVASMGGIIVAGCLPFFIRNFTFVLVMRAIVGFCIGLGFPLQSTLSLKLFNDEERPGVLGKATFVMACGSIFYMLVSGYVCDIDSAYAFLVHGVLIIPLALVLIFLKEPEADLQHEKTVSGGNGEKMPMMALFASAMFMFIFFAFYPVLLNMSAIIEYEGIGAAAITGIISSLYTIGNAIAGLVFAGLYKKAGKYIIPVGVVLWVIGMAIFSLESGILPIVVGVVISGLAAQIVWPGTVNSFSEYVPASKQSMASAVFVSGMNIGCFCTTFFISGVATVTGNANPRTPCQIGLVIVAVFAAIWSVAEIRRKRA